MNQNAIIREFFPRSEIDLYKELYKDLPESTIAEKITKLRKMHNLEKEELAQLLGLHLDTIIGWEVENVMPKPENIKHLCEYFNLPLKYIHEYYNIYFDSPGIKVRAWKDKNNYTYPDAMKLLNISHSGFARLLSGKINLSYDMYLKLKKLGAF